MTTRTRYAIVGLGGRSRMHVNAVAETYAELGGLRDVNEGRL